VGQTHAAGLSVTAHAHGLPAVAQSVDARVDCIGQARCSDLRQCLTARRLGRLQADNARCRIGAAHLDRDHADTNSHVEKPAVGALRRSTKPTSGETPFLAERPCSRSARSTLRMQQVKVRVHPPDYKRPPRGLINQVPALPERGAQLGAQLRHPLIGQDLPRPVNNDVRVTVPPLTSKVSVAGSVEGGG
jgi:hypothetical protein